MGQKIVPGSKNPTDQVITTMLKQKESFFRKYFCGCFPRDQPMKAKTDWGSFGDKAPEKAPADQKQCDFGRKQSNAGEKQPDWGLFGEKIAQKASSGDKQSDFGKEPDCSTFWGKNPEN